MLPDALRDALADGDFGIEDLGRIHLDLALAVPCDLLVAGSFDAAQAFDILPEVAQLAGRAARALVRDDCAELLAVLARSPRGAAPERLAGWLAALAGISIASGRAIGLAPRLKSRERAPSSPGWFERLALDLAGAEADGPRAGLPRVHIDAGELVEAAAANQALERGVEMLLARGRIVPTFGSVNMIGGELDR